MALVQQPAPAVIINPDAVIRDKIRYSVTGHKQEQCLQDIAALLPKFRQTEWGKNKRKTLLKHIMAILTVIAGGALVKLVDDILTYSHRVQPLATRLPAVKKYRNVIKKLGDYHSTLDDYEKWKAMQFVVPDLTVSDLQSLSWTVSDRSYRTTKRVLNTNNNRIDMTSTDRIDRDYNDTPADLKRDVHEQYLKHSRSSSNIVLKKETQKRGYPVVKRHLTSSIRAAWDEFPRKGEIGLTTFQKLKGAEFGKPKRDSDKCDYCIEHHFLGKALRRLHREAIGNPHPQSDGVVVDEDDFSLDDDDDRSLFTRRHALLDEPAIARIRSHIDQSVTNGTMTRNDAAIWTQRIASYRLSLIHRNNSRKIQDEFERRLESLSDHELLFLFDFKQNVVVGHCPQEEHWVFR